MKIIVRNALLAMGAMLVLNSCKKDDNKSQSELLTQKPWIQVSEEERTSVSAAWVDYFPQYDACERDDLTIFNTNGTYQVEEGPTKCDPTAPQVSYTGDWALTANNTITVDGSPATIDQLDNNTLVVSSSESFNGTTTYYRIRFAH